MTGLNANPATDWGVVVEITDANVVPEPGHGFSVLSGGFLYSCVG